MKWNGIRRDVTREMGYMKCMSYEWDFVSLRYPFAYRVREWVPGVRSGNPGWVSVMGWARLPYALSGEMTVMAFGLRRTL